MATKKFEAGKVRKGMKIKIPAQTVEIDRITEVELATLECNLKVFHVKGTKGPLRGLAWGIHCQTGDKVEVVLRDPPLRRAWDWLASSLWRSKSKE